MTNLFPKTFSVTWIAVGALWAGTLHAQVADFVQVNLVSDIPGLATITEPELINPWGVSFGPMGPCSRPGPTSAAPGIRRSTTRPQGNGRQARTSQAAWTLRTAQRLWSRTVAS